MAIPVILITIAKTIGKEAAIAAAHKYLLPKAEKTFSKVTSKIGKDATTAGLNHLHQRNSDITKAGLSLLDKRSRREGITTLAQIGMGTLGAAITAKYAVNNEAQKEQPIQSTSAAPDATNQEAEIAPDQNHSSSLKEDTRIRNEQAQDLAIRHGFNR